MNGRVRLNSNFPYLIYMREMKRWEIQSYERTFYNPLILGGSEEKDFNKKSGVRHIWLFMFYNYISVHYFCLSLNFMMAYK